MVIITGLGRTGTSVLTKYIGGVGFNLGKNVNWHDSVNAGLELSTFYTLIHDLYHRFCKLNKPINLDVECLGDYWKGYTYREALNKVDNDPRQGGIVKVIKDPRITWHPDIIEVLYEARPDIKLIICHRRVEDVYKSRKSLPEQYDDPKPRKEVEEYKVDFSDFYTKVLELDIKHVNLFFPNFLFDFKNTWVKLVQVGLYHSMEKGEEVWNETVDRSLLK